MAYDKQTWVDGEGGETPLSASRLNHMELGLEAAAADADLANETLGFHTTDIAALEGQISAIDTFIPQTEFSATPTWRAPTPMSNGQISTSDGQMILYPISVPMDLELSALGCHVWTVGDAGSTVRTVIYADTGSFAPGNLVADSGARPGNATGYAGANVGPIALPKGLYWIGVLWKGATTVPRVMQGENAGQGQWTSMAFGTGATPGHSQGNDGYVWMQTGLTNPPAVAGGSAQNNSNDPRKRPWTVLKVGKV